VTTIESALRAAVLGLQEEGASFALVGGLAVSVRTEPRFTRDADLAVSVASDAEAEALVRRLAVRGWKVLTIVEQKATSRLATVRLSWSDDGESPVIDLLFASSGIEAEVTRDADRLDVLADLSVPVATTAHLIALKLLARDDDRPQDQIDLHALVRVASADDLVRASQALALITARGYHRGRDLAKALVELQPRP
jgi:predicted nucleotidyltransferase